MLAVFDLLISIPPAKPVSCDVAPLLTCINLSSDVTVPTFNVIESPETVKSPVTDRSPVTATSPLKVAVEPNVPVVKVVTPVIEPPVTATEFAACVAIVPKPKEVLAVAPVSNTKLEPSPTMIPPSVVAKPAMSAKPASYACTSEPIAKPKFVLVELESVSVTTPPSVIVASPDITLSIHSELPVSYNNIAPSPADVMLTSVNSDSWFADAT